MPSFEQGDVVFNMVTGRIGNFFKEADIPDMITGKTSKYALVNAKYPTGSVAEVWPWSNTALYDKNKPKDFPFTFMD